MIYNIPCVILAGGKSSRMKEDKTLLKFGKFDTIVEYQIDKLSKYFQHIYISTKNPDKFVYHNILIDKYQQYSPMYAIKSIFESSDFNEVFIISADTPFVSYNTIKNIIEIYQAKQYDIVAPKTSYKHNLCGIYTKNTLSFIIEALNQNIEKIGYLFELSNSFYIDCKDEDEFFNINTPQDYKRAKKMLTKKI